MHIPVLTKEVLYYLDPQPRQNFIDATIGGGGHTKEILERTKPYGKVIGIDWNEDIIMDLTQQFKKEIGEKRMHLVCDNFANLAALIAKSAISPITGVLFDLGLSRDILERSGRGFSFRKDEPLVMTYHRAGAETGLTAYEVVNKFSEEELADVFKKFGEERYAVRYANAIIRHRREAPIRTSKELAEVIRASTPRHSRIHPATRVFQAIRIMVNDELNNLVRALSQALEVIEVDGRVVAISYHSLEDRIVKNTFREVHEKKLVALLTEKPVVPSHEEILKNPSSRSAKLRAVKKLRNP